MSIKSIQDILHLVEQPSRYLGSEINAVKKDHDNVHLVFGLVFPDLYEIGTSHFGLQILYHILNRHPKIAAERIFAPAPDMAAYLKSSGISLASLESRRPLGEFNVIGFSLLYELNYTNMLNILELSNIPFLSRERDSSFPFIVAGGPCMCNPEPVADFFDAIVIGDGENVIMDMCQDWFDWRENDTDDKQALLKQWSRIDGVYIPAFFRPTFDRAGFQSVSPRFKDYHRIKRAVVGDLNKAPFPDRPVIPYGKPVHDRLRLEVSRGCTRGCRFCQAGMIYRPVRERSPQQLLSLSEASVRATGYEDISLLSLSTGDYSCIQPLMENMMTLYGRRRIALSFPSLRAGTLTPGLMKLVKEVRKTGFTIALEAGSQRLRDVINKNIQEKDIIETINDAFVLGWQVVKLYFMVGLPTETDDDMRAIVELVKKINASKRKSLPSGHINVSVATFIPKPHTPFQWLPQISLNESKEKITQLKHNLKIPGIRFKWQNPEVSLIEGLWARGDRRLSRLLDAAYKKGCQFDGWSDKFKYRLWETSFLEEGIDVDFYTTRIRDTAEPLPWDHIDTMILKEYLIKEWEKAIKGEFTKDCRNGDCNQCGVCDFDTVKPNVFTDCKDHPPNNFTGTRQPAGEYKKLEISYSKRGMARYFGHLEMVKIFLRAIHRAEIPVKYSKGFHPKPNISFEDPLPIGLESLNETFYLSVRGSVEPEALVEKFNRHLPEGLRILACRMAPINPSRETFEPADYTITLKDGRFNEAKINDFLDRKAFIFSRVNRKGKSKTIDLKEMVFNLMLPAPNMLKMSLKTEPGNTVRPFEVLDKIFGLPEEEIRLAEIVKL
ncbi:MAG: TIGR03960 family B12-binding radical SAM protein [Desulfobacterales bacterium]